jgi:hypothetical protein
VHPERPPLAHQTVEQQRCILADLVVFGEEFLELVDEQQRARQGLDMCPVASECDAAR